MSERFLPADDVTMELATIMDEFSAVDCFRLKKESPIQMQSKRALSYKAIIKTNFPGATPSDSKLKLPDSIDMEYLDMLSGKNVYTHKEEGKKIPIRMESFEKLCYSPELTETQKQEMDERAIEEAERLRMLEEAAAPGCSPCCSSKPSSPKEEEEDLKEVPLKSGDESENEIEEKDTSTITNSNPSQLPNTSEEPQITESPILESKEESPEVSTEQNSEDSKEKKKKKRKSIFKRVLTSVKEKSKKKNMEKSD